MKFPNPEKQNFIAAKIKWDYTILKQLVRNLLLSVSYLN